MNDERSELRAQRDPEVTEQKEAPEGHPDAGVPGGGRVDRDAGGGATSQAVPRARDAFPTSVPNGFIWYGEIEDDGEHLLWDIRMADEAAAQRICPVHQEPGQSYPSAWYWSRVDADRLRSDAFGIQEIRAGRSYSQEFRCRRAGGELRWFAEDVHLESLGPGRWRAVGICTDITDRKQREEALDSSEERVRRAHVARAEAERLCQEAQEAARHKDEFLAMLAHELRNPLAPILNAVEVMRLRGAPDPALERARDVVERQVKQMARLLDDLLDVSRLTFGKIDLRREPVELAVVIENALQTSRPYLEAGGHELLLSLPAEPIPMDADPARLEQVISNLLNNAAKYTEAGGRIWLTVTRSGEQAEVSVRDTGVGLSPDLLPRIFDLFTQADRSLDRSQGGLGIGLTLVRRLVELHGGSVTVASAGPGHGSEFTVRLPIADPPDCGLRVADRGLSGDEPRATGKPPP